MIHWSANHLTEIFQGKPFRQSYVCPPLIVEPYRQHWLFAGGMSRQMVKNLQNLTDPSVRPDICHLKITNFSETCKSDPLMCQWEKSPQSNRSICHWQCQLLDMSSKILRRFPRRMSIWPVKPDTCHLFSGDSGNLLIWNCWSSAGGKKSFFLSLLLSHNCSLSEVSAHKSSFPLYLQKTWILGWRECVRMIISSPCTLNRTFTGT